MAGNCWREMSGVSGRTSHAKTKNEKEQHPLKAEEGYVVYENVMSSTYDMVTGPSGSITRDSVYKLSSRAGTWLLKSTQLPHHLQ
ncbi:hypothetical protein AAFF_G00325170 [Aldrovandia affinis]|uniref:Uncharacterized protein n=1 Tax=Aldrovandia affinis TaxID=143900 RepID=A0AAD7X256_9TELE|nr:hypothetical protein AAFF_G00325170 [Aldrovandia affinis]